MTDVQESDESLMSRYQQGDEGAFRCIFERYTIPLIHFAYRFIGSQTEAEDVAQEVFMRVYRHKDRYDARRPFRSWIFSITARLSANKVRDRKTHRESSLDVDGDEVKSSPATGLTEESHTQPERLYQSQVQTVEILRALQELPESQKTALLLCRFEEMSYDDISRVMGASVQAVKSLIFRGTQTLLKRLGKTGPQLSSAPRVLASEGGEEAASKQPKEPMP